MSSPSSRFIWLGLPECTGTPTGILCKTKPTNYRGFGDGLAFLPPVLPVGLVLPL